MAIRNSNLRKRENQTPLLFLENNSISQIKKTEIISLRGLNLSFSDLRCFSLEFGILLSNIGCELTEVIKSSNMGLFWYIKINIQIFDRLVLCCSKVLQQLTSGTFLCVPEKGTSREDSSANMEIFIGLKGLHAELPGLNMLDFFLLISSMARFGTSLIQS